MDDLTIDVASKLLSRNVGASDLKPNDDPIVHGLNGRAILETSLGLYLRRSGGNVSVRKQWFEEAVAGFRKLESSDELEPRSLVTYATALDNMGEASRKAVDDAQSANFFRQEIEVLQHFLKVTESEKDYALRRLAAAYLNLGNRTDAV